MRIDVLTIGMATWDLTFLVSRHPGANEKMFARQLVESGGGPAATAAFTSAWLGVRSAFIGYLGKDAFGEKHLKELHTVGVNTDYILRRDAPTPLSVCLVKPDGLRTVVSYPEPVPTPPPAQLKFPSLPPAVLLLDGRELEISRQAIARFKPHSVPVILDAGSVHTGTRELLSHTDYLICSEKFARQYTGESRLHRALQKLARISPVVVITRGEAGLLWQQGDAAGELPAYPVHAVDTTAAGDVFHGAFAAGLAMGKPLPENLRFASAAAALACTGLGSRSRIPTRQQVEELMNSHQLE